MKLLVVRHGQPFDESETGGEGDPPLSELGHSQAKAIGEYLAAEHVDHIVASPMVRAHQTALPLSERLGLDVELDERLKEAGHAAGRYRRAEENLDWFKSNMNRDPDFIFAPETKAEFFARIQGAFADIAASNRGKNVAVFCHGMVTAALVCKITEATNHMGFHPTYSGLTRVEVSTKSDYWTLHSFNETAHLR